MNTLQKLNIGGGGLEYGLTRNINNFNEKLNKNSEK